jgi:hypothetical protein
MKCPDSVAVDEAAAEDGAAALALAAEVAEPGRRRVRRRVRVPHPRRPDRTRPRDPIRHSVRPPRGQAAALVLATPRTGEAA